MMTQSPAPAVEFNFESASTSPYVTAPSSPQRFFAGSGSNYFYSAPASPARISATSSTTFSSTFHLIDDAENPADFAFDFSGHLETPTTLSADELFYAGVIKPLQVPPQEPQRERGGRSSDVNPKNKSTNVQQHKTSSRSLLRVSDILLDGSKESSSTWYSKWSLMFRSKSEGSAAGAMKKKKCEVDLKNGSMRRKGMSSHELHYTENRAAAEEMRKKTPLPYKHAQQHGWLGCLGFSPPNFDAASSLVSRHHRHNSSSY